MNLRGKRIMTRFRFTVILLVTLMALVMVPVYTVASTSEAAVTVKETISARHQAVNRHRSPFCRSMSQLLCKPDKGAGIKLFFAMNNQAGCRYSQFEK